MKITVIGTINKDLILPFHGAPIESFGGIFYNIAVLSQLCREDGQIIPVSFIGEDVKINIDAIFEKVANVYTEGLIPIEQKNHKVILEYESPSKRREKALFNFPPLTWNEVKPFLDSDMVIVNMVTGWDINKKTFLKISKKVRSKLYVDVHFLVMGIDKLGRRFPERPDSIEDWINGSRFVQMNRREYQIIASDMGEVEFYRTKCKPDQIILITNGSKGVDAVFMDYGKVAVRHYDAPELSSVIDPTGSGDVFGSAFVFNYLKTNDLEESIRFANIAAAANTQLQGTNEMQLLQEAMEKLTVGSPK